jgi:retron-type reverse transcriptase
MYLRTYFFRSLTRIPSNRLEKSAKRIDKKRLSLQIQVPIGMDQSGKLMDLLEEKIKDRRFTNLIRKALKAGYLETKSSFKSLSDEVNQSNFSAILGNIYLHQLDSFIEGLKENRPGEFRFRDLAYVRYRENALIGIRGPEKDLEDLQVMVYHLLRIVLLLEPRLKKAHLLSHGVTFLGAVIHQSRRGLQIAVDLPTVKKQLTESGFIKGNRAYPKYI